MGNELLLRLDRRRLKQRYTSNAQKRLLSSCPAPADEIIEYTLAHSRASVLHAAHVSSWHIMALLNSPLR
jgi:hypothetical protein